MIMKATYYPFKIKTTILLLFICIFGIHNLNAQDTIFYPDERYFWEDSSATEECIKWFSPCPDHPEDIYRISLADLKRPVFLKEIIFPSTTETRV